MIAEFVGLLPGGVVGGVSRASLVKPDRRCRWPVCTCMFHLNLQKHPFQCAEQPLRCNTMDNRRSSEMSAPVRRTTLKMQNATRLRRSSMTAKTMNAHSCARRVYSRIV